MKRAVSTCLSATLVTLAATTARAQPADGGPMSFDGGFAISNRLTIDPITFIPSPLSNGNGVAVSVIGAEGLVVWKDNRDSQDMLYASRISALGKALDPGGIRLVKSVSQRWGVVPFGANHLIFMATTSSPYRLLATRVTAQGTLIDSTPIEVVANMGLDYPVGAACTPQVCLFAWAGFNGFKSARLSAQGVALDPAGVTISPNGSSNGTTQTEVATDGTDFLASTQLSYLPDGGFGPVSVVTARVLASTGRSTGLNAISWAAVYPASLTGSPSGYVVASKAGNTGPFLFVRLDPAGAPIDTTPISIPNTSYDYQPALVFSGSSYQATWRELPAGGTEFKGVAIAPSGAAGALAVKTLFSSTSTTSFDSLHAAAGAPSGFWLTIAHATRTATENLPTVNRFDVAGRALDGDGIPFRLLPSTQQHPTVAWGTTCYLAVWEDNVGSFLSREIFARRFDREGQPLDLPFRIASASTPQRSPQVAFDGQNFFVVWTEGDYGSQFIRGARVSQAGAVVDPAGVRVSPMPVNAIDGRVAFTGGVYGVLWQTIAGDDMKFQRVNPAGQVLDLAPVDVRVHFAIQSQPALFANGNSFLALWLDSAVSTSQVFGSRISAQGLVQDLPPINVSARPAGGNQGDHRPSAAFGMGQWLVVYNTETSKEVGTRLSDTGQVLEARRPLSFPGAADYSPSATAFDGQRFRYLWSKSTSPASMRFGSWDTSSDAGFTAAAGWEERADDLAWAQGDDGVLILTEAPNLTDLPNLPRVFRRMARFCVPGSVCAAPNFAEDGGLVDGGVDGGLADSGVVPDAGLADAGSTDAGGATDAGATDAGVTDAGLPLRPDAGSPADSGQGTDPIPPRGCGCGSTGTSGGPFWLALLLVVVGLRLNRDAHS